MKARMSVTPHLLVSTANVKNSDHTKAGKTVWKSGDPSAAGGSVRCRSHAGQKFGSFLYDETCSCHVIQQSHSWASVPEKWKRMCLQILCTDVLSRLICNKQWT